MKKIICFFKAEEGSFVVELCLLFPMLLGVIFLFIDLFLIAINDGMAAGELYTKLYNKETYILGSTSQSSMEERLETDILAELEDTMRLVQTFDVSVDFISTGDHYISNLNGFQTGNLKISIDYEASCPGIFTLIKFPFMDRSIMGCQEIRDTSNNLRRWQLYGQILSD